MPTSAPGRYCWYELMVPDIGAAKAFYSEVLGWRPTDLAMGNHPYTMFATDAGDVAGLMELPRSARDMGAPPHIVGYVAVDDIQATNARIQELGGRVVCPPTRLPFGQFLVFLDPQGATLAAFEPNDASPVEQVAPRVGEVSWNELVTDDFDAGWAFYSSVFGWTVADDLDMGELGIYRLYTDGRRTLGGIFPRPQEVPVSCWVFYVRVDDLGAALDRVRNAGGKVLTEPMEVPGGDHVAQCLDNQGTAFALHQVG